MRRVWSVVRAFLSPTRSREREKRLLAVGGIHAFEDYTPCTLASVEPKDAVKDLGWTDKLALEARREGAAEVVCGSHRYELEIVAPFVLEIALLDDADPKEITVRQILSVRARINDGRGRELEVGKFTNLDWACSDILADAIDRSAGEFGYCDTCYGMYRFRAAKPGSGFIEARLGDLRGTLEVVVAP